MALSACSHSPKTDASRTTEPVLDTSAATCGGEVRRIADSESGVGWSISAKTETAVSESLQHAGGDHKSDLVVVLYTPQHKAETVLSSIRGRLGPDQRVIGMTSHEGVLTSEGFHSSPDGALGILSLRMPQVTIGVGGASFDEATPSESARLAFRRAAKEAGKSGAKPSMVLLFSSRTAEEGMLAVLTEEIGPDVPLVGGTAAGRAADIKQKRDALGWSMIANDRALAAGGVAIAVFYSAAPFVYAYGGGFSRDPTTHGTITDAEPRMIKAIDGRPAFQVYDEWQNGRAKGARDRGEKSLQYPAAWLVKHLSKNDVSHEQFVHVFMRDEWPDALFTDANVANGEVVYRSQGSWNTLLNRFADMPREARAATNDMIPVAGLFFYCAGALNAIPAYQRSNMAYLVSEAMGELPWLGVFSWGEQGHVRGVGNLHGNLMSTTLLFPGGLDAK
jgi:hypothetical protein